jgi:uncharacterized iron-regulated protein
LAEKSLGKKIILIGELHGTKEIPELLTNFFSEYIKNNDFDICLELSSSEQGKIDEFLKCGDEKIIKGIFCGAIENDGRRTMEYLELVKAIYKINKKYSKNARIICIDVSDDFESDDLQNEREKVMARNILASLARKTFAILGNIHASKEIISISAIKIIPAGWYISKKLKKGLVSINLIPKKGKFYNLSIKEIDSNSLSGFNKNYDFNYYLESVSHATITNEE